MAEQPNSKDRKTKKVGKEGVIEIIGEAIAKNVFCGKFDEKLVVIKRVDHFDIKHSEDSHELNYLREFDHENVVKYKFKDDDDDFLYMVLEKCDTTLAQFITGDKKDEIYHLDILWQISKGLAYLHEDKGLVHRDLKPSNVLMLLRDKRWVAKITDFGISKSLPSDRTRVTQSAIKGTDGYMAPEQRMGGKIGKQVSDHIISQQMFDKMKPIFEERRNEVAGDWRQSIRDHSAIVGKELDVMKTKRQGDGICDLVRNIRNLKNHYDEKATEFKVEIGEMPDGVYQFFKLLFPKLLNYVYDIMKCCAEDSKFVDYYFYREQEHLRQPLGSSTDIVMEESLSQNEGKIDPQQIASLTEAVDVVNNSDPKYSRNQNEVKENAPEVAPGTGLTDGIETTAVDKKEGKSDLVLRNYQWELPQQTSGGENSLIVAPAVPQHDSGYQALSEDESETLVLRKYQWELADKALNGLNSLIVAPTGSGKTAVLAGIIREHFSKHNSESRVMFMVPKTALAHQQYLFLSRYLPYSVEYIIGELTPLAPSGQKILENEVTVLTAQILINELKKKPEESYVTFDKISMLIFDECHNATKRHPYKQIMDMFIDYIETNPKHPPIQVVGVTASPGVGKSKDRVTVKKNLMELLANLDITTAPSIVEKNLDELRKHQNKIGEYYIRVQTETQFGQEVMAVMEDLEEVVKKINAKNDAQDLNKIPKDRYKQSYEKWTDDLKQYAKLEMRDQESARILITYAEHLKMYNTLLQLKDLVPNAMKHTNKMVTFQQEGFENKDLFKRNQELQKKATDIKVPMLDRLVEILQKEFRKNPDARCIVFVKRKLTARSLEECIAQHKDTSHLNPKYLIGTHDSDSNDAKITKNCQKNVLKAFQDGETKVVVATSMAEEGLDIKECNLVIMYNYVTGEVGRIQRRGRGRAADSRAILITSIGSNHLRLEADNKIRAQASDGAIQDVKSVAPDQLEKQIRDIQENQKVERRRKEEKALKDNRVETPSKWEIICAKCKNFLTTGDKLRHIEEMHIVVKDSNFESRVIKQMKDQKKGPNIVGTADFLCNNPKCGMKVALEMVYKQSRYPTLSIKKLLMRKEGGKVCDPKKRSLMPFTVTKAIDESDEEEELEYEMSKLSLTNVTSDDDENLSFGDDGGIMEALEMMQ